MHRADRRGGGRAWPGRRRAVRPVDDIARRGRCRRTWRRSAARRTGAALLALPGAVAALAAEFGQLAAGGAHRRARRVQPRPGRGGRGPPAGAAIPAVRQRRRWPAAPPSAPSPRIPTGLPAGVYAAARGAARRARRTGPRGHRRRPTGAAQPVRRWAVLLDGALRRLPDDPDATRWRVSPAAGALAAAALPTALALASLAPALVDRPGRAVPVADPDLAGPAAGAAHPADRRRSTRPTCWPRCCSPSTAALAATGFSGGRRSRAVPVVLPGAAVTLLITPIALGPGLAGRAPWPRSRSSPSRCSGWR